VCFDTVEIQYLWSGVSWGRCDVVVKPGNDNSESDEWFTDWV